MNKEVAMKWLLILMLGICLISTKSIDEIVYNTLCIEGVMFLETRRDRVMSKELLNTVQIMEPDYGNDVTIPMECECPKDKRR